MELIAVVMSLLLLEYYVFVMLVGKSRMASGVLAPAMTGDARLERALRVQTNTLEQLIVVLPAMWLFGLYLSATWGAVLGLVFGIGRLVYCIGYMADPAKRGPGFLIGFVATLGLILGSLYGALVAAI